MNSSKYGDLIAAIVRAVENGSEIPQDMVLHHDAWKDCIHAGGLRVIHSYSELDHESKDGIWVEFVGTGLTVLIIKKPGSRTEPSFANRIQVTVEGQGFATVVDNGELCFSDKTAEATLDRILAKIQDTLTAWSKRKSAKVRARHVLTAAISII